MSTLSTKTCNKSSEKKTEHPFIKKLICEYLTPQAISVNIFMGRKWELAKIKNVHLEVTVFCEQFYEEA